MVLRMSIEDYKKLYGGKIDPKKKEYPHFKPKKKKSLVPTEHQEQCKVIQYCRYNDIKVFAVPNAAMLSFLDRNLAVRIMGRLKAEGLSPGALDLVFPIVTQKYPGLYIEMKRTSGGKVSEDQQDWLEYLKGQGYKAVVCKGADAAILTIQNYLKT